MEYRIIASPGTSDVEVKKSHFLCDLKNVHSEEEAKAFLDEIRHKYHDASHHCFAMRIGAPGTEYERFSDDGEPSGTAGKPMLGILKNESIYDVCAVVTRYFGGTLLGTGGLLRAYSDSLKEGLSHSTVRALSEGVRFSLTCDYSFANRVKYLAENMSLFTEKEEYSEVCRMFYLTDDRDFLPFTEKIREMSGGKVLPAEIKEVLFYKDEMGRPILYT